MGEGGGEGGIKVNQLVKRTRGKFWLSYIRDFYMTATLTGMWFMVKSVVRIHPCRSG